ncbi:NrfD/PsrC family molybdoenzyme membrane anchor subunit [Methylobacterium komagatae]
MSSAQNPAPAIRPGEDMRSVGEAVTAIALHHPAGRGWWIAFAAAAALVGMFVFTLGYLVYEGVGIWDNNNAVVWALDIASYDWWIGVACGSLLVSGILLLLGVEWRGPVSRVAETVALLATAAAGLYPIIHLGRPWYFYWNLPYPNTFGLWPQFRSPLLWDAIDIVSFLVLSVSLWYIGLLPDIACLRDRAYAEATRQIEAVAPTRKVALFRARAYGILASGWRGSAAHWQIRGQAYRIVALLGILLVVAVQTGASVMLAGSVMPGWHGTLLPITFLIHAVLSGVGVTAALIVLVRGVYGLTTLVTDRHLDVLARLMLCPRLRQRLLLRHGDLWHLPPRRRRGAGGADPPDGRRPRPHLLDRRDRSRPAAAAVLVGPRPALAAGARSRGHPRGGGGLCRPCHGPCRHPDAGFPALVPPALPERSLGRGHLRWLAGPVPGPHPAVRSLPALALDHRNPASRPGARPGRGGSPPA